LTLLRHSSRREKESGKRAFFSFLEGKREKKDVDDDEDEEKKRNVKSCFRFFFSIFLSLSSVLPSPPPL